MKLKKQMAWVKNAEEYDVIAQKLDILDKSVAQWRDTDTSQNYEYVKTRAKVAYMRTLRQNKDLKGIMRYLLTDLRKNQGGVANEPMYRVSYFGTKQCIEEYHEELLELIKYVYYYRGIQLSLDQKAKFFDQIQAVYGRTALCLSGGASLCKYHFGLFKALVEQDLMPRILAGASAGAITAARMCTLKYDEVSHIYDHETTFAKSIISWKSDSLWELIDHAI